MLASAPFTLTHAIDEEIAAISGAAAATALQLHVDITPCSGLRVLGDRGRLKQVRFTYMPVQCWPALLAQCRC